MTLVLDGALCLGEHPQADRSVATEFNLNADDTCLAAAAVAAGFYSTEAEAIANNVCLQDFYGASNVITLDVLAVAAGGFGNNNGGTVTGGGAGAAAFGSIDVPASTSLLYTAGTGGDTTQARTGTAGFSVSDWTNVFINGVGPGTIYLAGGGGAAATTGSVGGSGGAPNGTTIQATEGGNVEYATIDTVGENGGATVGGGAGVLGNGSPRSFTIGGVNRSVGSGGNHASSSTGFGDGGDTRSSGHGHVWLAVGNTVVESTQTFNAAGTNTDLGFEIATVNSSGQLTTTIPAWDGVTPGAVTLPLDNGYTFRSRFGSRIRTYQVGYQNPNFGNRATSTSLINNSADDVRYKCGHLGGDDSTELIRFAYRETSSGTREMSVTGTGNRPTSNARLVIESTDAADGISNYTTAYVAPTSVGIVREYRPNTWRYNWDVTGLFTFGPTNEWWAPVVTDGGIVNATIRIEP